ncbi:MAG: RNA polymerase sigma factor [Phycisphaerales bacterium]
MSAGAEPALPVIEVLERARASIHRFVHVRAGGDGHLVDEVMQQLWMAARRGPSLAASAAEAWLRGAARNLIANHWRGVARRPASVPMADPSLASDLGERMTDPSVPLEVLGRVEARNQLLLALTEVESAEQDLLVRFYFQGQAQALIAQELGISERAVEGRLHRARQALRARLGALEG